MPTPRIFIDGHAGTTGLRIREWLSERSDLEIWTLEESERKSEPARRKAIAEASKTIKHMRWFQVTGTRGHIENNEVAHWQVSIKVGFTLED